jgi:hypothetical protein
MTIADHFLAKFGPTAFQSESSGMSALKWLSDNDPDGVGQLIDGGISYQFSDSSRLIFDRATKLFTKVN